MMIPPRLAERPFTWPQAREAGITRKRLEVWLREGVVRRTTRSVYRSVGLPDTIENRASALSLAVSQPVIFCDRTAAWLLGVDVLDYTELEILPDLDCVVIRGGNRVQRAGCLGGERDLLPDDVCEVYGVLVTAPPRTAFDLACVMSRWQALATLDQFMRICGVTTAQMEQLLPRYRGRRGVVQLRCLVPLATPLRESTGESFAAIAIHDDGLPMPVPQYWVEDHGVPLFRLDLAYPHHKIAVEYDGVAFHDQSDEQREADEARRKWLADHGWHVIVVTKDSFRSVALQAWLAELRDELAARRPAPLRRH